MQVEELDIAYKGIPLKNLTITHLVFFNAGRKSIRSSDIPKFEPITLKTSSEDIQIIGDPVITDFTRDSNKLSIRSSNPGQEYVIDFDYLAYNDGAIIQIAHTGTSSKDLTLEGVVIEGQKIRRKNYGSIAVSGRWTNAMDCKPYPKHASEVLHLLGLKPFIARGSSISWFRPPRNPYRAKIITILFTMSSSQ